MPETLPITAPNPAELQRDIVQGAEWQPVHEITDNRLMQYPVFSINGSQVIFRNRNEFPELSVPYHETGDGNASTPVEVSVDDEPENLGQSYKTYLDGQSALSQETLQVVPNTPLGMVTAAIELGANSEDLTTLQEELNNKVYSEKALLLLDGMAAAIQIDDEGKVLNYIDPNGYGLVLSALTGNEDSQAQLTSKLDTYKAYRDEYFSNEIANARAWTAENRQKVEALSPDEVVLVHSTAYPPKIDENGAVHLQPAGAHRPDEYPRSSLHFTVNGEVESHMFGKWDETNRLIITNFKKTVDKNGLPATGCDVDTFFDVDPGEDLVLPDALILEARKDGELMTQEGNVLSYAHKDKYSEDETKQIEDLFFKLLDQRPGYGAVKLIESAGSPAEKLRKIALFTALKQQGSKWVVSVGAHYVNDLDFQSAFYKMIVEMGVGSLGIHDNTAESNSVKQMGYDMAMGHFSKFTNTPYSRNFIDIPDAAARTLIASGYVPARPLQESPESIARKREMAPLF